MSLKKTLNVTRVALLSASLACAVSVIPTPAEAWRATEPTLRSTRTAVRDVQRSVERNNRSTQEVRQEVRELGNRLIEALRLSTGESSAFADKQIEAQRRFMDASEQNQSERLRQEFRARAESGDFDPSPAICLLAGMFRSGGTGPGTIGTQASASAVSRTSGSDPAVQAGGATLARAVIDRRAQMRGRMGVDDPAADPAAILMNPTIASTSADMEALEVLMQNLIDPLPPRPVTASEAMTPEGVVRAHRRTVQETRNNTSREVLSMLANMRSPVQTISSPTGGSFQAYIDDIANYNRPIPSDGMISELQAIDIRTLRHYAPRPEVFAERATLSERGLLQELLDAVSIGNRIAFLQLELDSRRAAVETQILSTLNNN